MLETGDDSKIPSDLTQITFRIVSVFLSLFSGDLEHRLTIVRLPKGVQEGGRPEWEAVKRIAAKPKNPGQGIAAMSAMGYSKDLQIVASSTNCDGARYGRRTFMLFRGEE